MKARHWHEIGRVFLWIILLASLAIPAVPAVALSTLPLGSNSSAQPGRHVLQAFVPLQTHIEKGLLSILKNNNSADFIITMAEQADLSPAEQITDWNQRGEFVYNTLLQTAQASQAGVIAELNRRGLNYQSFIIGNEIYVYGGNMSVATQLNSMPDVADIRSPITIYLDPGMKEVGPQKNATTNASITASTDTSNLTWGIIDTKANQFWSNYTVKGDGIVVASIDTGVQWDHPALINQYKCASNPASDTCWKDPANICGSDTPCDNNGHGTHIMGTMVGTDSNSALAFSAGMAPHAQWIACKGCETSDCSEASLDACADWLLAPGGNSNNRPNVVNNSWGGPGGDTTFQIKVQAWRAAGIFPAYSAGNSGPACSSLGSPGDFQESFASTAHDITRTIASFASRGPSLVSGSTSYTKPNISAPGVNVCSSMPGSNWGCYNGTSMASPHSAGAVALLWSCNNSLIGQVDQTMQILQNNADTPPAGTCPAPVPAAGNSNYIYGYGYLDVNAAGGAACSLGTLTGTVSDASGTVAGAQVTAAQTAAPYTWFKATTNASGVYSMVLPGNTYNVTVIYGSDAPGASNGVVVTANLPSPPNPSGPPILVNFTLSPGAAVTLSGTVSDNSGHGYPLYAEVDVSAVGFSSKVFTDPFTGAYQMALYQGIPYDFTVKAILPGYNAGSDKGVVFSSVTAVKDFGLQINSTCSAPGNRFNNGWIEAFDSVTPPLLPGHWVSIPGVGTDGKWETASRSAFPADIPVHSPPNLVHFNSYTAAQNDTARLYYQTPVNMTTIDTPRLTFWMYHEKDYSSSNDRVQPQVSTDGGVNWINVGSAISRYNGTAQWTQHTVDLSAYATQTSLLIGLYAISGWGNDINMDDIALGAPTCQSISGGLVAGLVSDANSKAELVGVNLSTDTGASAVSFTTPQDTNQPDGLYWLFQPTPPTAHAITATASNYYSMTQNAAVTANAVTRQDFPLYSTQTPLAPDNLTATPIYQTRIDLNWHEASLGVTGFKIERSPDGLTGWAQIGATDSSTTTFPNTGLNCGVTYFYRVLAYNASGNSAYSNIANAATIACNAPPSPPSNLTATAVSQSEIDLAWQINSTSETNFMIERSPDGLNGWTQIDTTTAGVSSYPNSSLHCGTTYFYQVRAYSPAGYSAYTLIASAATVACNAPPSPPSDLTAAGVSSVEIDLTWKVNSTSETSFKIERSPNGANTWALIASTAAGVSSYANKSLSCGTTYFYRVRAYGPAGYSAYSNTASVATLACPETPSLTAVALSTTQIKLTWVDSASDMTDFRIERSPDGINGWTLISINDPSVKTFTNSSLTCGTPYSYRVRAYYASGGYYSAYSNIASASTQACPVTPSLTAVGSNKQITLTWVDSASDMTNFRVERSPDGINGWTLIAVNDPSVKTFTNSNLTCGTPYSYRVRAYYASGGYYSAYSNIASASTQACSITPSLTAVGISTTQITLTWVDSASDMTNFRVERSPDGSTGWTLIAVNDPSVKTFTNSNLTCGTPYSYRVRAYYASGGYYSAYSNIASAATLACPETPSLTAVALSTTQIKLTWVDSASDMTNFRVERSPDGSNGWTLISINDPSVKTFTNSSLTCGTPYSYRVRAYYASGGYYSAYSNIASASTQACPVTPSLTAVGSNKQITLTWVDSASDMTNFRVERSPDGSTGWTLLAVNDPSVKTFTNSNLTCGTTYSYRVRAYYASGGYYSAYSNIASATTLACTN